MVEAGRRYATPLLAVLVVVETTDLVFAVDSIPAIFAVTRDPFIVYTSNIFAILGLRALFFVLAGTMEKFHYLKVGLGLVLAFVGVKMLSGRCVQGSCWHFPWRHRCASGWVYNRIAAMAASSATAASPS